MENGKAILESLGVAKAPLIQKLEAAAEWLLALSLGRADDMPSDRAMHAACEAIAQARALAVTASVKGQKANVGISKSSNNDEPDLSADDIRKMVAEARQETAERQTGVIKVKPKRENNHAQARYNAYLQYVRNEETDTEGSS